VAPDIGNLNTKMGKRLYEEKLGHLATQSNKTVKKILGTKNNVADSNVLHA